ncbi:hypothetical protein D9615_001655 [Tricholomella constricta]|uniref:Uncharacterized protein n=1 Tax=Tricholomella constricta TaxID=117010 RepID=A0A8H5HPE0_9AGAR|nr:hypothetical protein D9615_001655 [Tricholomella constricta]
MSSYHCTASCYYVPCALPPVDDLFVMSLPEFDFPPSPSDTSSTDMSPPQPVHVVCNAPLVAPIPLPYHPPTFLQFELLPDIDQDLSRPPYTRRSSKRKRESDEVSSAKLASKKRSLPPSAPHPHRRISDTSSLRHHTTHGKRSRVHTHT